MRLPENGRKRLRIVRNLNSILCAGECCFCAGEIQVRCICGELFLGTVARTFGTRHVNIRCPFCCFNQCSNTSAKCLNGYRFLLLEASDISAEVTFAGIGSHECRVRYSRTSSCIFRISVRYPVDMSENSSGVALTRSCKSKF